MYKLRPEQEEKFEEYFLKYQDKIKLAVYKSNIKENNYNHFYSHALEGFLQSFLILDAGDISEKDFPAFAFTTMKRKIIDELRRVSKNKDIAINIDENYKNISYVDYNIEKILVKNALKDSLTFKENKFLKLLEKGYNYKEISKIERVSKSQYYNILGSIKLKYNDLLYK
ncbi:sigma-70 family RNA polymerase sigma factor [Gemella sp. 19428wG2_WT2a]|nr:sigma-70 family RNA polymerase sigma factor [Gemella sp. 19428wG2_WT2a]TFU58851.1 sigma-70 family RNA polymerase sigma factor [Gemella sp. WT2a]